MGRHRARSLGWIAIALLASACSEYKLHTRYASAFDHGWGGVGPMVLLVEATADLRLKSVGPPFLPVIPTVELEHAEPLCPERARLELSAMTREYKWADLGAKPWQIEFAADAPSGDCPSQFVLDAGALAQVDGELVSPRRVAFERKWSASTTGWTPVAEPA
jgi:hypothetical protein